MSQYLIKSCILILFTTLSFASQARDSAVALVTKLSGTAVVKSENTIKLLSELHADDTVIVSPSSAIMIVFYEKTQQYEVVGPAEFKISKNSLIKISGNEASYRGLTLTSKKTIKINPLNVTQAAVLMRESKPKASINLYNMNETTVLSESKEFSWEPIDEVQSYRFQLIDKAGDEIYQATTSETNLKLPDTISLLNGADYQWRVSAQNTSGKRFSNIGQFKVANAELTDDATEIVSQMTTDSSVKLLSATWLLQHGFKDDAKRIFEELKKEIGENDSLKVLAE